MNNLHVQNNRYFYTATRLHNGKILFTGYYNYINSCYPTNAELYDLVMGAWSPVPPMSCARIFHTATLLDNGKVLVVGGLDGNNNVLASAELYDPVTSHWLPVAPMSDGRYYHSATLLSDGRVLVIGGYDYVSRHNEIYDPIANTW